MAKIDTSGIEGYADMTPEQKLAALEGYEYEDHSADVDRYKSALDKASSEAAEWKHKHNALLSAEEQKKVEDEERQKAIQDELDALRLEKTVSDYVAKFTAQGYDADLAESTAKAIASGDMKTFFANQTKFLTAHDSDTKQKLLQGTPKPGKTNDGSSAVTLEEFRKMSPAERYKFSLDHPEEYKKIYGGS